MKGVVVGDVVYSDAETREYLRGHEGLSPSLKAIGRDVSTVHYTLTITGMNAEKRTCTIFYDVIYDVSVCRIVVCFDVNE